MLSLHWQQSFLSAPASCRMTRSHAGEVAVVTGVAAAITEAAPGSEAFMAAVTALPAVR
jgi:hypothetical protein